MVMIWTERRDGDWLVANDGKILGRVSQGSGTVYHAECIYAGGGTHKQPLGDYISSETARAAVERHAREVLLPREQA